MPAVNLAFDYAVELERLTTQQEMKLASVKKENSNFCSSYT